jgi:cyclic di-GMP phosphodiesterase
VTRLLVVEDENIIRELLVEILAEAGYDVVSAPSAEAALELVDEDVSLVLSDISMSGLSGLELLSAVRTRRPSLPVVLMTGAGTYDHLTQALAGGADGLVTKPFSHNALKAAIAAALDRTRRSERELRQRLLTPTLASALANAIEARDGEAAGHCERVARLAVCIAAELRLGHAELEAVRLGAILHDVGKIGIPDRVLLKSDEFGAEELALMRTHPIIGDRLLEPLELLESVRPAVRHHHERWDGQGYPDRFTGPEIPLESRVLGAADALEAMTSARPYKDALTATMAAAEVEASGGTQFDPGVARVVAELLRRRAIRPGWDAANPIVVEGPDDAPRRLGLAEYTRVQAALIANGDLPAAAHGIANGAPDIDPIRV